ncbi:cryptochrome/photolyase family protein [Pinisolibacter sp.]|uniref:cryptochrome/photolyase family protein n=1 Tax=Pinisolibacter sp. TaxID=2172024 RepID=UPI002FDD749F
MTTSEPDRPVLLWLRDDLRIADNPALVRAVESGRPVVALFVLDEVSPDIRPLGGASRWWLHRSLAGFADRFARLGGTLRLGRGPASEIVAASAVEIDAAEVVWNRRYLPALTAIDADLKRRLRAEGRAAESFQANLLHEPHTVKTAGGGPFRVFTPFWRAARGAGSPRAPLPPPRAIRGAAAPPPSHALDDLGLLPRAPYWAAGLDATWTPGEEGAAAGLERFLGEGLRGYAAGRDRPDLGHTSRLSPHLRFGEISPFTIASAVAMRVAADPTLAADAEKFLAELGWREFAHHLAFHFGDLSRREFQPRFETFPWKTDEAFLEAWRRGRTGYPLVDAGMRELWATGTMHNRVRMVVASFLVKHGLVDWREGERWFFDTLVDACPAVNPASWQWVAGCGADAAPFFRIFNPVTQGVKFDPAGDYLRRWLPELAALPAGAIHAPWTAAADVAAVADLRLGVTYPSPIVDHAFARERALAALAGHVNGNERPPRPGFD